MRAALIVNQVGLDRHNNLDAIVTLVKQAANSGAVLILLPETALTGLIINDDPLHDLPLGEPIPGPVIDRLCAVCHKWKVWLGIGLLERDNNHLYDSAVLINDDGQIVLQYRRMHPKWHSISANTAVYKQGSEHG